MIVFGYIPIIEEEGVGDVAFTPVSLIFSTCFYNSVSVICDQKGVGVGSQLFQSFPLLITWRPSLLATGDQVCSCLYMLVPL